MMQWPALSSTAKSTIDNSEHSSSQATTAAALLAAATGLSEAAAVATTAATVKVENGKPSPASFLGVDMLGNYTQNYPLYLHPLKWSRDEVHIWLKKCIDEYSFTDVQTERFPMNGKALLLLKREDFIERAPYSGDVLYNILQKLIESQSKTTAMFPFGGASLAENLAFTSLFLQSNPFLAAGLMPGLTSLPFTGLGSKVAHSVTPPLSSSSGSAVSCSQSGSVSSPDHRPVSSSPHISHSPSSVSHTETQYHKQPPPAPKFHVSSMHEENNALFTHQSAHSASHQSTHPASHQSTAQSVIRPNHISTAAALSGLSAGYAPRKELDTISRSGKSDCRLLWEFISKLLKDPNYTDYIRWENPDDFTFRIVNPSQLSKLWGIQKNRTNMTYEKLSRALRYYYRMDIIEKVPGRRLTYRFMRPPHEIKRGQRGAKPGVPRKSRSTDDEAEEILEAEAMETVESEASDDGLSSLPSLTRPPIITTPDYQRINSGLNPTADNQPIDLNPTADNQPIDLVSHDRVNSLPAVNPRDCFKTEATSPRSRSLSPSAKSDNILAQKYYSNSERTWGDTMLPLPLTGKID